MAHRTFQSLLLTSGVVVAATSALLVGAMPAQASTPNGTATIRGQVLTRDGAPISGVRVVAGPYESAAGAMSRGTTTAHGRYVLRVPTGRALTMKFEDPTDRFFGASKGRFTVVAGRTYHVDRALVGVSRIAGTVRDAAGERIAHAVIRAYDARSGERLDATAMTNRHGRYHLRLAAGSYKVRFAVQDGRAEWFGDARTRKASPTVAVAAGAERSGIDATVE